jgi:hypothetical protein
MLRQILAAGAFFSAGCVPVHAERHQTVTVCDLEKAGRSASGSIVHFHATLVTDLFENSALIDTKCPAAHLSYQISKNAAQRNSTFLKALYVGASDRSLLTFEIWGTGRFLWQPGESPPGVIDIDKISSFRGQRK